MAELRRVGRFEILAELGRGGMAVVHLARQVDLDREVALKELPAFHAADPAFSARFARESQIAGGLNHPNIVTVHDYFEHEGIPYIAMEHMPSGSLRPHVAGLSQAQAFGVLEGALAALSYAGARGVVHRDMKPENLMLTWDGSVKVSDFGIAKAIDRGAADAGPAAATTVGTPAYMAPEQALGRPVDQRTDLYSVGVIAYEMLAGRVPFEAADPSAMLLKHVNETPPPPASVRPELDPRLAAWIEAMLAKSPDERPPDAGTAWERLEEIVLDLLGSRWRRDARVLPAGAPPVPRAPTPAPFSPEPAGEDDEVEGFRTYRAPRPAGPQPPASAPRPAPEPAHAAAAAPSPARPDPAPADPPAAPPPEEPEGADFQFPTAEDREVAGAGRRRALWIVLALVVVGGGVGGALALSGGGGDAPPAEPTLSAAEYREQGNRICGQTQAGLDDLLAGVPGNPTAENIRNAVELYLNSTVAERLNGLRALVPPTPLAADHDAVLDNQEEQREIFRGLVAELDEGAAVGESVPIALAASEPLGREATATFQRLGLTRCVS